MIHRLCGALLVCALTLTGCVTRIVRPAPSPWSFEARGVIGKDLLQRFTHEDFAELHRLGARDFAYVPFASLPDPRRPAIVVRPLEQRDSDLVDDAHAAGVRVMLKPHLWIDRSWPGAVVMESDADWSAFFAAYTRFIVEWARFAAQHGVDVLCVGTELDETVRHEREWRALIEAVRAVYRGRVVYASHHDRIEDVPFWDALDAIGVNAYFALAVDESASLESIHAAWSPIRSRLKRLSERWNRPIVFTEIGYRPVSDCLAHPWDAQGSGMLDMEVQARAYEAALSTFETQPWFGGVYVWEWYSNGFRAEFGVGPTSYSPQRSPAEDVLRAHWAHARTDDPALGTGR